MKKVYLYITLLFAPLAAGAQQVLTAVQPYAEKRGDSVYLEATFPTGGLALRRQQLLTVTPVLRSMDRTRQIAFQPVAIAGGPRRHAIQRAERLNGVKLDPQPSQLIRYHKKRIQPLRFSLTVPYQAWMRDAELVLVEQVTACLGKPVAEDEYRALSPVLPPLVTPVYRIVYAEPPVEAVKQRAEKHAARINFAVNRYDIRRNLMNNAAVLDEVDRIINEVSNDANLTVTEFKVTGYASPEGAAASNLTLSEHRAKSFVDYIRSHHPKLPSNAIQVDWKGDDWDGLRNAMEASNFVDKARVLQILNGTTDAQQRKNQLRALPSYNTLLHDYYPALRRNDYTISYVARAFSVEEAKTVIKTKPQQLSLNEMYVLANTYPKTSREFKEVFDIAARIYPNDDYANLNGAALEIENGALDAALARSSKVNRPEAWNNIGYIYIQKQDYTKAAEYFKKAADSGLAAATENLRQLNAWLANR